MEDYGFPIGSMVALVETDPCGYVKVGMVGVVCDIDNDHMFAYNCKIGVCWDEYSLNFHDCGGKCAKHHGRYVPPECLELVNVDLGEINAEVPTVDILFGIIL